VDGAAADEAGGEESPTADESGGVDGPGDRRAG
jgi:hypothetical protein